MRSIVVPHLILVFLAVLLSLGRGFAPPRVAHHVARPRRKSFVARSPVVLFQSTAVDSSQSPSAEIDLVDDEEDPIEEVVDHWRHMNINEILNIGFVVVLGVFILWNLTTVNADICRGWTQEETAKRIPVDAWSSYSAVLAQSPIATKASTSGVVYGIGDVIAQRTEGTSVGEMDRMRTVRSIAAGFFAHGPLSHVWYGLCDGFFDNVLQWTDWWSFLPKVAIDQILWGPFWNNTYILILGLMQFQKLDAIWSDIKRTTIPLIVSGFKIWPAAHLVTYGLVPVQNRLLWVDLVEILWVTILATQASGVLHEEHVAEHQQMEGGEDKETTPAVSDTES